MEKFVEKLKNIFTLQLLKNIALLAGALVMFYFILATLIMPLYTRFWLGVRVPDVSFMSIGAAEKIMADVGLAAV